MSGRSSGPTDATTAASDPSGTVFLHGAEGRIFLHVNAVPLSFMAAAPCKSPRIAVHTLALFP